MVSLYSVTPLCVYVGSFPTINILFLKNECRTVIVASTDLLYIRGIEIPMFRISLQPFYNFNLGESFILKNPEILSEILYLMQTVRKRHNRSNMEFNHFKLIKHIFWFE